MAVPRASVNLLRCGFRPVTRAAPVLQVRQQSGVSSDGDIGGPGSQQTPPPNPGFRETLNRNWRRAARCRRSVVHVFLEGKKSSIGCGLEGCFVYGDWHVAIAEEGLALRASKQLQVHAFYGRESTAEWFISSAPKGLQDGHDKGSRSIGALVSDNTLSYAIFRLPITLPGTPDRRR
ncbi:hypothetical protein FOXB_00784 [Fusarium oxysporum f. sp. conglutinans Fo5176]|uniref:Uncharacterized protein n=1 Tax=Fusarium oxysporum (strain Fo5176) TaxID=660025 RepID=F9F309_FUSOF|nr:hypothetical protein FOXB_00784 [Fusarium oxysporum f. sp. conglutinans Fo5176]